MSKAEALAQRWFHTFQNHRMLFGFSAMMILTACSIYFNFRLGQLNANPGDKTWYVMPLSYSFLDVAALVLAMVLFAGAIRGFILRVVSWAWFSYLVALSLFACLSCILALDAMSVSTGDAFKRQQLETALVQANRNVDTWQTNFERTEKHKSKFNARLNDAVDRRDKLINKISKLDSSTPPAQVVFEKVLPLMPAWMDEDMLKTYARLAFGVAMILTPLLLTGVLANVLGSGSREDKSLGKPLTSTESGSVPVSVPKQAKSPKSDGLKTELGLKLVKTDTNRTQNTELRKPRGTKHANTLRLKEAILAGEPVRYDDLKDRYGVGKSTISSVLKELADDGHVEKNGRKWVLRG